MTTEGPEDTCESQLLRLERLEPVNELVDLCQGVLRGAFGDATAEGMLANPNLAIAFSLGPITRT